MELAPYKMQVAAGSKSHISPLLTIDYIQLMWVNYFTASFNSLPALKAGAFDAAI